MTSTTTEPAEAGTGPEAAPAATPARRSGGSGLGRYILVRFLLIIPTVFILVTTVFLVMRSPVTRSPRPSAAG